MTDTTRADMYTWCGNWSSVAVDLSSYGLHKQYRSAPRQWIVYRSRRVSLHAVHGSIHAEFLEVMSDETPMQLLLAYSSRRIER